MSYKRVFNVSLLERLVQLRTTSLGSKSIFPLNPNNVGSFTDIRFLGLVKYPQYIFPLQFLIITSAKYNATSKQYLNVCNEIFV